MTDKKAMKKKKKEKKCMCRHSIGHTCNAGFCWCEKHWAENQKHFKNFNAPLPKLLT